jgi:two-component system, OmpR family, phosphate regulon response regulator PhoB
VPFSPAENPGEEYTGFSGSFRIGCSVWTLIWRKLHWQTGAVSAIKLQMEAAAGNTILIIEDERDVVDLLALNLHKAGFAISAAADGATGLEKARNEKPAFIILDLMLPKMPGLEVCKILKSDPAMRQVPIMMLTAKAEEIDRIVGLEFGADDYVTKPFSPREVILRIRAILRRGETKQVDERLTAGPITIDPARHEVSVSGKRINLTSLEFKLLRTLMQRRGRVQSRDRLLNDVWGYESVIDTRTVDTHVRRLRKKLGKAADLIESVRGFGYRLREN